MSTFTGNYFVGIDEAFQLLNDNCTAPTVVEISLKDANRYVLAADLYSGINMPPFRQSAMDGYALCLHDSFVYTLVGEVKAGDAIQIELKPGQAVKIFTGAAVPDSAQSVIQIEKVTCANDEVILQEGPREQQNVRALGEQIKQGELALPKGTVLNPAAIGFLAGLGFSSVAVFSKPSVGIIVTGNELVDSTLSLSAGKIFESNSIMLQSALHNEHYPKVEVYKVNDTLQGTINILKDALTKHDVLIISGGISVGDYDFVEKALRELAVSPLFYKVKQKPGKPLYVGKQDAKMIFALPGNPAACLTCFYVYVLPVLKRLSGNENVLFQPIKLQLKSDLNVNDARDQFLKAKISFNSVEVLTHQSSAMLNSFALANALVYVPNGNYTLKSGEEVQVISL
jgi:molybdopterin molybdotransferase